MLKSTYPNDSEAVRGSESLPSILIVDDNEVFLQSLAEVLSAEGFVPHCFVRARDAFKSIAEVKPDCIICDIVMPGLNGLEFFELLNADQRWNSVPFVFLTSVTDPDQALQAKELGCDDYLFKPFEPRELITLVKGKTKRGRARKMTANIQQELFKKRVLQTLSHEFRTPLVAVNTGTELLREQISEEENERLIGLVDSIRRGGLRLQRLVEDFMSLQQIQSGNAERNASRFRRICDLRDVAKLACAQFESEQEDCLGVNAKYEDRTTENSPFLSLVYDAHLVDAMQRVISNSVKFSGTEKPIIVSFYREGRMNVISFRDFGPGFDSVAVEKACQAFEQIDRDTFEQQGCGLGLPIASYLVQLNGGALCFIEPEVGVGSEARFSFPVVESSK